MKKQFLVEIEYKENEPELVTETGIEICIEQMMDMYSTGLIEDGWEVNVTEVE